MERSSGPVPWCKALNPMMFGDPLQPHKLWIYEPTDSSKRGQTAIRWWSTVLGEQWYQASHWTETLAWTWTCALKGLFCSPNPCHPVFNKALYWENAYGTYQFVKPHIIIMECNKSHKFGICWRAKNVGTLCSFVNINYLVKTSFFFFFVDTQFYLRF